MVATEKMLEKKLVRGDPFVIGELTEGFAATDAGGAGRGGVPSVDIELLGVITLNRFFWPNRTVHQHNPHQCSGLFVGQHPCRRALMIRRGCHTAISRPGRPSWS